VADFYPSDGEFDTPGAAGVEGYFRYTAFVADAAGNLSEELTFWVLHDVTAPDVGGIASPSTITGGESETFTADIEDNVDLGSIQPYVGFGGATYINFPHTGGPNGYTLLNDYSPESLIDSDDGSITFEAFVRSLEDASDNLDPGVPDDGYVDADEILYLVRDMAGHQLRYVQSPWKGAPDDGVCAGQNCTLQFEDITANVEAADDPAFTALATLNADGGNPGTADVPGTFGFDWGNWRVLPYDVGVDDIVCNSTNTEDECPTEASNEIDLEAVLQGPAGSFQSPFAGVWFLFLNNEGNLDFIATASVTVTDNTIEDTRTVRYRGTWNAADLKVRPAGDPGTVYTVYALGITEDGDALLSVGQDITVEGNPE
jgi:hypothetical protein